VVRPCLRRAAAFLTALALPCLAVLPPEHLHADDGEHEAEVHRHFEPHHQVAEHPVVPVEPSVEGHEAAAVYLTDLYLGPDTASVIGSDVVPRVVDLFDIAVPRLISRAHPARDLRAHDPPWARSRFLRGPPTHSALA
jgi:hypothetical protein